MYAHTHIYIYIYISQHVNHPNINALCLGGGTRCSGRVSDINYKKQTVKTRFKLTISCDLYRDGLGEIST